MIEISIGILISIICWVLFSMTILSLPAILTGGGFLIPGLPFVKSALYGLIVGVVHGSLTVVLSYKDSPAVRVVFVSIYAMEFLLTVAFVVGFAVNYFNRPKRPGAFRISLTLENIGLLIITLAFWFAVLSALFFIPSILIGLLNLFYLSLNK